MSDIHLTPHGEKIIGLDPVASLDRALKHALAEHSDACHLVFTGDLTHYGNQEEYSILKDLIKDIKIPITFLNLSLFTFPRYLLRIRFSVSVGSGAITIIMASMVTVKMPVMCSYILPSGVLIALTAICPVAIAAASGFFAFKRASNLRLKLLM